MSLRFLGADSVGAVAWSARLAVLERSAPGSASPDLTVQATAAASCSKRSMAAGAPGRPSGVLQGAPAICAGTLRTLPIFAGARVTLRLPFPARSVTVRVGGRAPAGRPPGGRRIVWRALSRLTDAVPVTAEVLYDQGRVFCAFAVRPLR